MNIYIQARQTVNISFFSIITIDFSASFSSFVLLNLFFCARNIVCCLRKIKTQRREREKYPVEEEKKSKTRPNKWVKLISITHLLCSPSSLSPRRHEKTEKEMSEARKHVHKLQNHRQLSLGRDFELLLLRNLSQNKQDEIARENLVFAFLLSVGVYYG